MYARPHVLTPCSYFKAKATPTTRRDFSRLEERVRHCVDAPAPSETSALWWQQKPSPTVCRAHNRHQALRTGSFRLH